MKFLKIKLIGLLREKRLPKLVIASGIMLVLIISSMNPLYAADGSTDSKGIINLDNFLSFDRIPTFETHSFPLIYEESEEIKKISGILEEDSKFKYIKGANSSASRLPEEGGDCWAMSEWLYKNIKKADVECRILQYETSLSKRHRSVQIKSEGEWIDLPYMRYGFDSRFAASGSKSGMFVYKN